MSDCQESPPIIGSSSTVGSSSTIGNPTILSPSPITLGSPPILLSPESPPILDPSPSILCSPSTVGSPTVVGSPSIVEIDRHPGLLDRMSSIGPSNTPNNEKFSTENDEKLLEHDRKDKRTTAVIWVFSWSEIVNYALQIAGITAGVVFGVWAIKSYGATETSLAIAANADNVSKDALSQSKLANQIALLSFCAPHLEAIPPSEFTLPCATVSKSLFTLVISGDPVGLMPPNSQINSNTTNPFGDGGSANGVSPSGLHNKEIGSQPTPSTSSQPGPQASADSSPLALSNSQALGGPNRPPPPKTTSPHQKTMVHFAVIVGIIAAVVAFLVAVGALLAGDKRLNPNGTAVILA
ncbi:uncharacterized protein LACBIDRAFT_328569 [Laccaria bicolor S238N-H82]|uniref:Predicted protein n=1 Tax=Laccaria bicolor (strain S238N-H82 / ATCC MYA-4686) TaxID=486041 RepID=B0DFB0_LACBS|nr:uncharacterized protein LACBIDRAFT_328569 [Laccaria bicolor S238N-H82]EDR06830.1 predicted protein [Laccaria bicolor S238N-H82]|eukprot:XP_001882677.1 predicted protein [Laccaria bicolor S238N-H82]